MAKNTKATTTKRPQPRIKANGTILFPTYDRAGDLQYVTIPDEKAEAAAAAVAVATTDAYSFDRYGAANWLACCRMLALRGLGAREIEAVMRSKWTRWAGDAASKSDGVTCLDLAAFIDGNPRECGGDAIKAADGGNLRSVGGATR